MITLKRIFVRQTPSPTFCKAVNRSFLAIAVLAMAWSFGCASECNCDSEEFGLCVSYHQGLESQAQVSGLQYGERTPDESQLVLSMGYACAYSSMKRKILEPIGGEIECLNPQTAFDQWGSPDMALMLTVHMPLETCSDSEYINNCYFWIQVLFDDLVEPPKAGAVFDLTKAGAMTANDLVAVVTARNHYIITGGTIEFTSVEADHYSFKINDLELAVKPGFSPKYRTPNKYESDPYEPGVIKVKSISTSCIPLVMR